MVYNPYTDGIDTVTETPLQKATRLTDALSAGSDTETKQNHIAELTDVACLAPHSPRHAAQNIQVAQLALNTLSKLLQDEQDAETSTILARQLCRIVRMSPGLIAMPQNDRRLASAEVLCLLYEKRAKIKDENTRQIFNEEIERTTNSPMTAFNLDNASSKNALAKIITNGGEIEKSGKKTEKNKMEDNGIDITIEVIAPEGSGDYFNMPLDPNY